MPFFDYRDVDRQWDSLSRAEQGTPDASELQTLVASTREYASVMPAVYPRLAAVLQRAEARALALAGELRALPDRKASDERHLARYLRDAEAIGALRMTAEADARRETLRHEVEDVVVLPESQRPLDARYER